MAIITLSEIKTLWSNVSNWVKGTDSVSSPKITVSSPLPSGTNNIGDVDIATIPPLATGTNIIGKVGIDQTTNGVVVKSYTDYLSNSTTLTLDTDVAITPSFTAQKVVFLINEGSDILISLGYTTDAVGKGILLKNGEGINDVNLEFSVLNARLVTSGGSAVLRYMIVG